MGEPIKERQCCIIAVIGTIPILCTLPRPALTCLGAPASGKGTLCKKLTQDPQFIPIHHVSVGDLLRGMGSSGPDINTHIAQGTVLPGKEIVPVLRDHISNLPRSTAAPSKYSNIILIDGFPRSMEQEALAREPLALHPGTLFSDLAIYFLCEKEELKRRYVERRREQDDAALFEKRYEQHERECPAVVQLYRERGILVEVSLLYLQDIDKADVAIR